MALQMKIFVLWLSGKGIMVGFSRFSLLCPFFSPVNEKGGGRRREVGTTGRWKIPGQAMHGDIMSREKLGMIGI